MEPGEGNLRLLYLEDDPPAVELVRALLAEEGLPCELWHADSPAGFSELLARRPDVVLADYNLPGMDGRIALDEVIGSGSSIPVIIVTGALAEPEAIELLRKGATDFVLKDSIQRLPQAVRRAVREASERRERIAAETALRESEARFRRLAENAADIILRVVLHPEIRFEYVNPAVDRLLGFPPSAFYSDPEFAERLLHPGDRPAWRALLAGKGTNQGLELRWTTFSGLQRPMELAATWVRDSDGRLVALEAIARDLSRRKADEERIRLLSRAVAQSPVALEILSAGGRRWFINPKGLELLGLTGNLEAALSRGATEDLVCDEPIRAELDAALAAGQPWSGEIRQRAVDGAERWLLASFTPIPDESGGAAHFLAVKEDITARRQEQERRQQLENQLLQAQKLEAIGTLAGGIAHDFNNILGGMLGHLELALLHLPAGSLAHESLRDVQTGGERAKALIAQILKFSRTQRIEQKVSQLAPVVREALALVRAATPAIIDIRAELCEGSARIDSTQIHQVVMNLCSNAVKAVSPGPGWVEVSLRRVAHGSAEIPDGASDPGCSHWLVLGVRDNGHGIPKELSSRVWDPFFTTRPVGQGTGLGLPVTRRIVEAHQGRVVLESVSGTGTEFRVYLPEVAPLHPPAENRPPTPSGRGEMVFVLDDETTIVRYVSARLGYLGYRSRLFTAPEELLAVLAEPGGACDLLIVDQTMPRMTGLDVIRELRGRGLTMPIILMSGYGVDLSEHGVGSSYGVLLLEKPFSGEQLAHLLARLLPAQ